MSAILDSALDAERQQACRSHDGALSAFDQALARMTAPKSPAKAKASVDLLSLVEEYGTACHRDGHLSVSDRYHQEHGDTADTGAIRHEVERLYGCEWDRDQLLDASTGVLLVLSRLELDAPAQEAVEKFRKAVAEAMS